MPCVPIVSIHIYVETRDLVEDNLVFEKHNVLFVESVKSKFLLSLQHWYIVNEVVIYSTAQTQHRLVRV